jgi:hypothetical protein
MHLRCQHRDRRDRQVLDDHPVHLHLAHQNLEHHQDVDYQSLHLLDEERHRDEGHQFEEHRPGLDERQLLRLGAERHLGEVRDPCPGLS